MDIILVDSAPAMGHLMAFINLGKWLKKSNFQVIFICTPKFNSLLARNGFEYYNLDPIFLIPEYYSISKKGKINFFLSSLISNRKNTCFQRFKKVRSTYFDILEKLKPKIVLVDDHHAIKGLIYKEYTKNIILVSTMTLPRNEKLIPPFQSDHMPNNTFISKFYIKFLWRKTYFKRFFKKMESFFLCFGNDNLNILLEYTGASKSEIDFSRCYGIGLKRMPIIATHPRLFDFKRTLRDNNTFYFGNIYDTYVETETIPLRLKSIIDEIEREKKLFVYCSLGTITYNDLKTCASFFDKIINVAEKTPNVRFILNVGEHFNISMLSQIPKNLSIFKFLPQTYVLKYASIMINHGGINSIKECIKNNVPMLIYPLSLQWDQNGCAARAIANKLAIKGNLRKEKAIEIGYKINLLFDRLKYYKIHISNFNKKSDVINEVENDKIMKLIDLYIRKDTNKK